MRRSVWIRLVIAAAATVALAGGWVTRAEAGGGSKWHITVTNPTDHEVLVVGWYVKAALQPVAVDSNGDGFLLAPHGGSHTFDLPGAYCGAGVTGVIDPPMRIWMQEATCLGNDVDQNLWAATCCWNVTFEVCRKRTSSDGQINQDDFGFCKK